MSTGPSIGDLIVAVAGGLSDAREELNRLDGVAGDGDLGLTAGRAAEALLELAPTLDGLAPAEAVKSIGMAVARRAPSTGGTLIAFALLAAARVEARDDQTMPSFTAAMIEAARDEVSTRGKVAPGDRTMLDALAPAAAAFRAAADRGGSIARCLTVAAAAAEAGSRSTVEMEATTGRAGWLADRARGHEDAGARLIAVIFKAAASAAGEA
jgi:dihydroxyacetone kinase-like protein